MKVKRFFAPDMRQAIQKVREDQGPDAVILSNRQVEGGIEIIAAIDYDDSLMNPPAEAAADTVAADQADTTTVSDKPATAPTGVNWTQDPAIVSMREEISQLRGLLENQLAHLAWHDRERREPLNAAVMRRLTSMELHRDLIEQVAAPCVHACDDEHAQQLALTELAASLPIADYDFLDQGGIVALVGSSGDRRAHV